LVWIEIDDEAWELYKKSWALMGVKTHAGLVRMLERYIRESSMDVLGDAENILVSDEPEALVRREIGLMKGRMLKQLIKRGFSQEEAEKYVEYLYP